jgi:hypothetical protein
VGVTQPKRSLRKSFALGHVGGPHLLEAIAEAGLEDAAGDHRETIVRMPNIVSFPHLFFPALEDPYRLRLLGGESHAALGPQHFDEPGIHFPGARRFVEISSGTSRPATSVVQWSTALSHVSHGAIPPLPSGRSV